MRCLCCGEVIDDNSSKELETKWHDRCVKEFFGTTVLPGLAIDKKRLEKMIAINVGEGLTIPGVQKKFSLYLEKESPARLTLVDYPTGYIMKPQASEYENLPEYEWLAMMIAKEAGIKVVPFSLYDTGDELAYITRRVDRRFESDKILRFAMEDFCQLAERLAEDKYKGSYEACVRIIRMYSDNPGLDVSELFLRVVVSFVVGNSDLHLKNFSLREKEAGKRRFGLSEAYDVLPVNVVEPLDLDEMALSLNGKKRELELEDFLEFADYCKIGRVAGKKIIQKICEKRDRFVELVMNAPLGNLQKEKMKELVVGRCDKLE
ncbi:HipA domain-containing protein [Candidatus Saccharibacteria bacterium]|nr:HipA domain-containing protein [Candidatus Saccharibacteria bacterium]